MIARRGQTFGDPREFFCNSTEEMLHVDICATLDPSLGSQVMSYPLMRCVCLGKLLYLRLSSEMRVW